MQPLDHLTKVNDICLYVKDFKGCLKHYTEKFGFRVKRLQPDESNPNYVEFDFQGTSVTMWDRQGVCQILDEKYLGGEGHPFMIAIKVPTVADVDDIHEELTQRGVVCISPPQIYPFGSKAAYYQDYERNIWEVFAWIEGNGPGLL